MLVTRQDIILLKNLSTTKEAVDVDTIPTSFKKDFKLFFFGKTFFKNNNTVFAYPHDIKQWAHYMFHKYNG